ncbi:SNF2-related protein [Sporolactobacillus sp. KGMB 08714]|uniref:SNF2-related protein n=1 Tax=Sporolactobacillus sp. KGMB 08714 TaxID=3064704 RepID=UPI003FA78BD1
MGWGGLAAAFDPRKKEWIGEYQTLKELLTDEEYRAARSSTLTSYYTDPELCAAIFEVLDRWGIRQGRLLDPSMGTGNFFSALPEKMRGMERYGVEIDSITARISRGLFPESHIMAQGFETVSFQKNSFDAIVSNIPFNDIRIMDPGYDKRGLLIHDYFFEKSLDLVKPGGVVAFITSRGTLDRQSSQFRQSLANRAALIGAVRLPNSAFQRIAGTKITTDVIFLQKRASAETVASPEWQSIKPYPENPDLLVNEYFVRHPAQLLGEMKETSWIDGETCVARPGEKLMPAFRQATGDWLPFWPVNQPAPEPVFRNTEASSVEKETVSLPEGTRLFTYFTAVGELYYYSSDGVEEVPLKGQSKEKLKQLCDVRTALNRVIQMQMRGYAESEFSGALLTLNEAYDRFVTRFGYISQPENSRLLDHDDQKQLLLSIEVKDDESETYHKADVFRKATIRPALRTLQAESAREALVLSLNEKLKIDFNFICRLYPHPLPEIFAELEGEIFLDPKRVPEAALKSDEPLEGWVTRSEYLSGDVKTKLDQAQAAAARWPERFSSNISALETVIPADLKPSEIDYRIGSTWIPVKYYQDFMYQFLKTPEPYRFGWVFRDRPGRVDIDYNEYIGKYRIIGKHLDDSLQVTQVFGTGRVNAYELLEMSLNLQDVTIRDTVIETVNGLERKRSVVNPKQTILARNKQQQIQEHFKQWLFSDSARADDLFQLYNDRFNRLVTRSYDGSALKFPGMNAEMKLRPHQENVVARILYQRRALMAHEVGAGKTAAMIAAGMYLKRVGAVQKPIYVVPNHLTEQWAKEFLRFYPAANVLTTTKKDFEKEHRKQFIGRIATGSYDAVIIGHSQFERIPLSQKRQKAMMQQQIDEITEAMQEVKSESGDQWSIKQLERAKRNLEERLQKLSARAKKDDLLTFEQLGVDFMFVDEAHVYKNLFAFTKMQNVAGVNTSSSQRATDMLLKCRYLQEQQKGAGVVFATGTPISNSMSEMYTMMNYLEPDVLSKMGLEKFDSWASTFGEVVSSLEITPEGSGYRMKSRFAKFHNLPELMTAFNQVADIQTADMLDLPVPKIMEGKAKVIVTDPTPFQKHMMEDFAQRAEAIRTGGVDPSQDNMLKITNEARLMAIDPRLVNPAIEDDSRSKLHAVVGGVYKLWEETRDKRLTQMIFADAGTPNAKKFNAYDEIKRQLIARGVPAEEIAFVHDAKNDRQREELFRKVRAGDVRIILGSTGKLGTGTNAQTLLIALHHVDCPWRPSDLTQRDGRGLRQGNENEGVWIYRYVTKGTFDSYLWQIQEQKLKYISQIMTGKSISRSCADLDETVLSAAEVKALATSNPHLLEKMALDNEIARLQLSRNEWQDSQLRMKKNLTSHYPNQLKDLEKEKSKYNKDQKISVAAEDSFRIVIMGKSYDERQAAIEALQAAIKGFDLEFEETTSLGQYRHLHLLYKKGYYDNSLLLKGENSYETSYQPKSGIGNLMRLQHLVDDIPKEISHVVKDEQRLHERIQEAKEQIGQPFAYQERLDELLAKQAELNLKLEFENAPQSSEEAEEVKYIEEEEPPEPQC